MQKKIFFVILLFCVAAVLQSCKEETNPVIPPSEHFDPHGWIIRDDSLNTVLIIWEGVVVNQWNGFPQTDTLYAPANAISEHLNIAFLEEDSTITDPPLDSDYTLGFVLQDTAVAAILPDEAGGWGFQIQGKETGSAKVELQVLHIGHVDIRTPLIPIVVKD